MEISLVFLYSSFMYKLCTLFPVSGGGLCQPYSTTYRPGMFSTTFCIFCVSVWMETFVGTDDSFERIREKKVVLENLCFHMVGV